MRAPPATRHVECSVFFDQILALLPASFAPNRLIANCRERFQRVCLAPFSQFEHWLLQRHFSDECGFDWPSLRSRDPARAMRQPKSDFKPPIPTDVSAAQHVTRAMGMTHPFALEPALEKDLQFAIERNVELQLDLQAERDLSYNCLRDVSRALQPLDDWLLQHRHVAHVAGMRPAFVAALVILLRWPDKTLPQCLANGFPLVGPIPPSGIFRPIEPRPEPLVPLLGSDAAAYVDSLEADTRLHPSADIILSESLKEQKLGLLGPFQPRAYFDKLYGHGLWRPLKRHTVHQGDKERPIDDGKAGRHNECSQLSETIVNQRPDFPVAVLRAWFSAAVRKFHPASAAQEHVLQSQLSRMTILAGTEDLWKGYRQNHPTREHMAVNIITFVHPGCGKRVYAQLFGLPFGLASAVNQFNRAPQLITATLRRVLLLVGGHYFDDSIQFEVDRLAGSHKRLFARLLQMFGVVVSHAKRQHMTVMPRFLGMVTDFSQVHTSGHITLHGCPDTVERAKAMLEGFLQTRKVTSGQAAKARGVLNWLEMSLLGRPLTAAFAGLIARQYYESTDSLTPALQGCIECLLLAFNTVPARSVPLFPRHEAPLLIYTDASTEAPNDTGCRIGFWIMDRGLVHVSSVDVPTSALSQWLARKTYINLLELLAAPILATCAPQLLRGRDVLWFIDNQAALAALVRSASSAQDISQLALFTGVAFTRLRCNPWYEWIPSRQNPSDPLSRSGLQDPHVREQLASGNWKHLVLQPQWFSLAPDLVAVSRLISALG